VDEFSLTVTFWPAGVVSVKLEPDTLVTVPEDPPGSGPERALDPPPEPAEALAKGPPCPDAAVVDAAVVVLDELEVATRPMESPATAHTIAAPVITMFLFRENSRRNPEGRSCPAAGTGAGPIAGTGSGSFAD
jgi:hypothetical protein